MKQVLAGNKIEGQLVLTNKGIILARYPKPTIFNSGELKISIFTL